MVLRLSVSNQHQCPLLLAHLDTTTLANRMVRRREYNKHCVARVGTSVCTTAIESSSVEQQRAVEHVTEAAQGFLMFDMWNTTR
jgi:hypothetical protein